MASGRWEWFPWDKKLHLGRGNVNQHSTMGLYVWFSLPACTRRVPSQAMCTHAVWDHLLKGFYFSSPKWVSAAISILTNVLVRNGGVQELFDMMLGEHLLVDGSTIFPEEDHIFSDHVKLLGWRLGPVMHWVVLAQLLFFAGARVQRVLWKFDMQGGGSMLSFAYQNVPVLPRVKGAMSFGQAQTHTDDYNGRMRFLSWGEHRTAILCGSGASLTTVYTW